jgi:hypothetical protein
MTQPARPRGSSSDAPRSRTGAPSEEGRWEFEGIVSGRGLYRVGDGECCFYLQRIFDAFQEKRVRITVQEIHEPTAGDGEGGGV